MSRKKNRPAARVTPPRGGSAPPVSGDSPTHWLLVPLVAATWIAYWPSLSIPFLLDGHRTIRQNPLIQDWQGLHALWASDPARFVGMLTFVANHRFEHFEVRGYHLVNLVIHSLTICAVYALARALLRCPRVEPGLRGPGERWIPIVAAAVFALHPLHVPAVSYIVQRFASLAALFYVAAVTSFVLFRLADSRGGRGGWLSCCIVASFLAFLTKQNTVTLPLALLLAEWLFFYSPRRWTRWASLFGLSLLVMAGLSVALLGGLEGVLSWTRWAGSMGSLSFGDYLATQMRVLWEYVRMFVWPAGLHFDHEFAAAAGFLDPRVLLAMAGHLAVIGVAAGGARRAPLPALGVLLFYVAHGVESVIPLSDLLVEHRTYLPDVGLCLAAAWLIIQGLPRLVPGRVIAASLAVILVAAGLMTHARNTLWQDPIALWRHSTELSPHKARGWSALAKRYILAGQTEAASQALAKSISLNASGGGGVDPMDLANVIATLTLQDQLQEALDLSGRALATALPVQVRSDILVNRGIAFARLKRTNEAEVTLREALRLRPTSRAGLTNLGNLFGNTGRLDEAEALYLKVLSFDAGHTEARTNLEKVRRMRVASP